MTQRYWFVVVLLRSGILGLVLFSLQGIAQENVNSQRIALRLFRSLTGVPLMLDDPRLSQMETHIRRGRYPEAARIATADPTFYQVTVRHLATPLSNRDRSPYVDLNDFIAMVVGVTRDNIDARQLLVGNFTYHGADAVRTAWSESNNLHYEEIENGHLPLATILQRVTPRGDRRPAPSGLLTSRAWAQAHLSAGTNRRAVERSIDDFLCTPLTEWRESDLPDTYIRRDVDRRPGGSPQTFQAVCRRCHAGMDAFGGAFARYDFTQGRLQFFEDSVAAKYNQNATNYPQGYETVDDRWTTLPSTHQERLFGWRRPLEGRGLRQFGMLLGNSQRFKSCMTERVFREVCSREPTPAERTGVLAPVAQGFERERYRLRWLFEEVATLPACLGQNDLDGTHLAISHFRQVNETLAAITRVSPATPEISRQYREGIARLPRNGRIDEINQNSILAITALSGFYCRSWVTAEAALVETSRRGHAGVIFTANEITQPTVQNVIERYARLFWQREVTNDERTILMDTFTRIRGVEPRPSLADSFFLLCSAVASSLDTYAR